MKDACQFWRVQRHAFNGLIRCGPRGFNVPFAKGNIQPMPSKAEVKAISIALRDVEIYSLDFDQVTIPKGAVIYCDPPYAKPGGFVGYGHAKWGLEDAKRFWAWAKWKSKRNPMIISYRDKPSLRKLASQQGWIVEEVKARRSIGASTGGASHEGELLIRTKK